MHHKGYHYDHATIGLCLEIFEVDIEGTYWNTLNRMKVVL